MHGADAALGVRIDAIGLSEKLPKTRVLTRIEGYGTPNVHYTAFDDNINNVMACLRHRVLMVKYTDRYETPIKPEKNAFNMLTRYYIAAKEHVPEDLDIIVLEDVHMAFPATQRTKIKNGVYYYLTRGWEKKDSEKKCFLKFQKEATTEGLRVLKVVSADEQEKVPVPRMICPSTPKYNAIFARVFKVLEGFKQSHWLDYAHSHPMFHAVNQVLANVYHLGTLQGEAPYFHSVLKGFNYWGWYTELRNHWDLHGGDDETLAIGVDVKRMSTHFQEDAVRSEHKAYTHFSSRVNMTREERKEFLDMLKRQLQFSLVWDTMDPETQQNVRILFKKIMKCDGDLNTAPGAVVVMTAIFGIYFVVKQVRATIGNNGDDNCLFINKREYGRLDPEAMVAWFARFGFPLELEYVTGQFNEIVFCQHSPCIIDGRGTMIRKPEALIKDTYALGDSKKAMLIYECMRDAGMKVYKNTPVLYEFYKSLPVAEKKRRRKNRIHGDRLMQYNSLITGAKGTYNVGNTPHVVSSDNRYNFFLSTGITPAVQILLEERYRNRAEHPSTGRVVDHWIPPPVQLRDMVSDT